MQASTVWQPPGGTLGEILAETRQRLASLEGSRPASGADGGNRPPLGTALRRESVAVIAEIKRRSPSRGAINPTLDAAAQARSYQAGGAAAVSVLTEPTRFGGTLDDLRRASGGTTLPLLKKDFHISVEQLREAADTRASGVLLIARALPQRELTELARVARDLGLEPVIEVRSDAELEAALASGARIVGVNSRDLETLQVDETVPERLIPRVPADVVAIWESGVRVADDVRRAADAGADAVLVGSALSASDAPLALLRELCGVPRKSRG